MRRPRILALLLGTALAMGVALPGLAQSPVVPPIVIDQVSVVIVQLRDPDGSALTTEQLAAARAVIEARLAALAAEATVMAIPQDRIRIDLADASRLHAVTRVVTAPGVFRIVGIPADSFDDVVTGEPLPEGLVVREIVAPGHIAHAGVGQDQLGHPAIDLQLDAQGADAFDAWASENMGGLAALVLDDVVVSAATINAPGFEGRVQVSGSFDPQQAQELVAVLDGGALPVLAQPLPDCLPAGCPVPSVSPRASVAP
jgi:preprotein translocase subunit SecD